MFSCNWNNYNFMCASILRRARTIWNIKLSEFKIISFRDKANDWHWWTWQTFLSCLSFSLSQSSLSVMTTALSVILIMTTIRDHYPWSLLHIRTWSQSVIMNLHVHISCMIMIIDHTVQLDSSVHGTCSGSSSEPASVDGLLVCAMGL